MTAWTSFTSVPRSCSYSATMSAHMHIFDSKFRARIGFGP